MGGKGGRCLWLTTLPPSCADCLEILDLQRPGNLLVCTDTALPLPLPFIFLFTLLDTVYSLPRRFEVLMAVKFAISPVGYDDL